MHFISVVILLITCSAVYSYTECSVLTKWPQEVRDPLLREIYSKFTPRWWSSWKWFKGRIKAFFKWITPSWLSWTLWLSRFSYAPLSNVKDLVPYKPKILSPMHWIRRLFSLEYLDYDCNLELKLAGKSIKLVEFFLSFAGGKDLQLKYENETEHFDAVQFAKNAVSSWSEKHEQIKKQKRFGCYYHKKKLKHSVACIFAN